MTRRPTTQAISGINKIIEGTALLDGAYACLPSDAKVAVNDAPSLYNIDTDGLAKLAALLAAMEDE